MTVKAPQKKPCESGTGLRIGPRRAGRPRVLLPSSLAALGVGLHLAARRGQLRFSWSLNGMLGENDFRIAHHSDPHLQSLHGQDDAACPGV